LLIFVLFFVEKITTYAVSVKKAADNQTREESKKANVPCFLEQKEVLVC
jgi:hypothetical protein